MTQLIGNPRDLPVLKAAATLDAIALIDASPYADYGVSAWASTNVFLRQIRNLVIDGTAVPPTKGFQGIHWPASQATTIQNVKIRMTQDANSVHAGIFVENGKCLEKCVPVARLLTADRFRWSYGRPRHLWRSLWHEHRQPAVHYEEHQDLASRHWYLSDLELGLALLRSLY